MKKDFDFDDIGKRTPYRTPDGFFEDVQRKVMERAGVKQQRKSHMKLIISTVITMAAVLIGFLFVPSLRQADEVKTSSSKVLANGTESVDKWIKELSDEELEELVSFSENDIFLNKVTQSIILNVKIMKTKFIYVIMAVLLMGSQLTLSAQNTDNKQKKQRPTPEQMVQMQTKQIVKTLMLDDATAAKFTPVYEKYLKELRECRMMTHKARTEKTKGQGTDAKKERPSMTDDEIATMLRNQFTQSRKMLDVREKYYNEFSKILSQKQILKIYQQEKMNANKFKKEFDRRKGQKPGQGHHQGQRSRAPRPDQK